MKPQETPVKVRPEAVEAAKWWANQLTRIADHDMVKSL